MKNSLYNQYMLYADFHSIANEKRNLIKFIIRKFIFVKAETRKISPTIVWLKQNTNYRIQNIYTYKIYIMI